MIISGFHIPFSIYRIAHTLIILRTRLRILPLGIVHIQLRDVLQVLLLFIPHIPSSTVNWDVTFLCIKIFNWCVEICQVRLDFFKVVLQQPKSTTGSCTNTYTTITPGASGVTAYNRPPALCGTLTDQHCKNTILSLRTITILPNSFQFTLNKSTNKNLFFTFQVYLDSGRSTSTIATIKITLASASDNYWRVRNVLPKLSHWFDLIWCLFFYESYDNLYFSFTD